MKYISLGAIFAIYFLLVIAIGSAYETLIETNVSQEFTGPRIPGYNLFFLTGALSIVGAILIALVVKNKKIEVVSNDHT